MSLTFAIRDGVEYLVNLVGVVDFHGDGVGGSVHVKEEHILQLMYHKLLRDPPRLFHLQIEICHFG